VRHDVLTQAEFRRTVYFRDFCDPIGFYDSSGAIHRFADGDNAVLHFTSARLNTYRPGCRTFRILELVQPALAAGASVYRTAGRGLDLLSSNDPAPAIALVSLDGRLLHLTPALTALLSSVGAQLTVTIQAVARELGGILRERRGDERFVPRRSFTAGGSRITVSATFVDHLTTRGTPTCLVAVNRVDSGPAPGDQVAPHLTEREIEVARLIADGLRNREIATSIGVSEHTARRHTEHVLRKLGVTSRAAVALALQKLRGRVVRGPLS
jgi:DNA-binding CsgD family transcriptional regulator